MRRTPLLAVISSLRPRAPGRAPGHRGRQPAGSAARRHTRHRPVLDVQRVPEPHHRRATWSRDLSTPGNQQAKNVAETIQRVDPDVLLVNEFDYDPRRSTCSATTTSRSPQHGATAGGPTPTPTSRRPTPASPAASTSTTTAPSAVATTPSASVRSRGSSAWSSTRSTPSTPTSVRTFQHFLLEGHARCDAARRPGDGRSRRLVLPRGARGLPAVLEVATGTCRSGSAGRPCTSSSRTRPRRSSTVPRTATAPATSTRSASGPTTSRRTSRARPTSTTTQGVDRRPAGRARSS